MLAGSSLGMMGAAGPLIA